VVRCCLLPVWHTGGSKCRGLADTYVTSRIFDVFRHTALSRMTATLRLTGNNSGNPAVQVLPRKVTLRSWAAALHYLAVRNACASDTVVYPQQTPGTLGAIAHLTRWTDTACRQDTLSAAVTAYKGRCAVRSRPLCLAEARSITPGSVHPSSHPSWACCKDQGTRQRHCCSVPCDPKCHSVQCTYLKSLLPGATPTHGGSTSSL
jgi:hypothetical protein